MGERTIIDVGTQNGLLEVQFQGSTTWQEIAHITNVSSSGGDGSSSTTRTYRGALSRAEPVTAGAITFDVGFYVPYDAVHARMVEIAEAGTQALFRLTYPEVTLYTAVTGDTLAVTTTGAFTAVNGGNGSLDLTADGFGRNAAFVQGNALFVIDTIATSLTGTVQNSPASDVTAAAYDRVVRPTTRMGPFSATVNSAGNFSAPQGGSVSSSIGVQPIGSTPTWSAIIPTTS